MKFRVEDSNSFNVIPTVSGIYCNLGKWIIVICWLHWIIKIWRI